MEENPLDILGRVVKGEGEQQRTSLLLLHPPRTMSTPAPLRWGICSTGFVAFPSPKLQLTWLSSLPPPPDRLPPSPPPRRRLIPDLLLYQTSWISTKFSLDLLVDPSTRDVNDVSHVIAAVASRSVDKAAHFVEDVWKEAGVTEGKESVKLYGNYEDLYADPVRAPSSMARPSFADNLRRLSTLSTSGLLTRTTTATPTTLFRPERQFYARRA
mgnify:FL=1